MPVIEQFAALRQTTQRLSWLIVLALLPWLLVAASFYVFHSVWMAIILYGVAGCTLPYWLFARGQGALLPINCRWQIIAGHTLFIASVLLGGWYLLGAEMLDWLHFGQKTESIGLTPGLGFWLLASYFVLINPIVEELFWRGLVYQKLKVELGLWRGLMLSSLLFGAWHWVIIQHFFVPKWQLFITAGIVIAGITFGRVAEQTKTLGASIIIHSLGADLPIMLILLDCFHRTGH